MGLRILAMVSMMVWFFSCSTNDQIILVANHQLECVGVTPQKCLQIKEEGSPEWISFYDAIEGFDYVEGFYYKLKVAKTKVENPPADGSPLKFKLIEVLGQSKAPFNLDQGSWLVTRVKETESFGRNPFIKIDLSENLINGNTSCNRFSAKIEVLENSVDISQLSSSDMICRDMHIETNFLEALSSVTAYRLQNDKLQLLGDHQELLIECDYLKSE